MKTKFFALPFAMAVVAITPAHAEEASSKTQRFIEKAAIGGLYEVETSRIALEKSANPDVKAFAQQMIDDHTKANAGLKAAVAATTLTSPQIPTALDKEHQDEVADLKSKTGTDFDEEYISDQEDAHEDAVALFKDYASDGDNAALKEFASKTLPTLEEHKKHVESLDSTIN